METAKSIDLLEAIGGPAKCRELSAAFYARVHQNPILRPLFPGKTHRCAVDELTAFLARFLCSPSKDARRGWWLSLRESHLRFHIGQQERDAWMEIMAGTLRDVEISQPMRIALQAIFDEASAYLVNTGPAVPAAKHEPEPSPIQAQLQCRWALQRALDEAVAEVRKGDLNRAAALAEGPLLRSAFQRSRSLFAQFVGVMIGSSFADMADYALKTLLENSDLAHQTYSGKTLLHEASAAGNLLVVTALLNLRVDAGVKDAGGHTPLYSVGNECRGGGPIVRALVQAGAKPDACDGAKRCTALHMAARRGNVEVAQALLECGASIDARDSLGETPLRRAVNCGQTEVAALLLAKGADAQSLGSKGLTPQSAARTPEMRRLFETWAGREELNSAR